MKSLESEIMEAREDEQLAYFTTFKNITGQLWQKCENLRQEAYTAGYEDFMASPDTQKKLLDLEEAEKEYAAGETKQDPHGHLVRQKIEADAVKAGNKAKKEAVPSQPLGVAILLREFIRFVRIEPAVKHQVAPLYYYDPDKGCYIGNDELLKDLIQVVNPKATEKFAKDTLYIIARKTRVKPTAKEYTALGNVLLNADTGKTEDFTPDIIVTRKIVTKYKEFSKEPVINGWKPTAWLKELFDYDEELYQLAIQIIKAAITGQSLKKIFWFYGEGGTGKGTLQKLITNLVGLENMATLKITEMGRSRFTNSILLGKSVVIGDDVQKGAVISDTSEMFSLASDDPLTIEEKGKQPYSLYLNPTIIQSSNGFPIMDGDAGAIDRRFRILSFTKVFKGNPKKEIKDDYINRTEILEYLLFLAVNTPTKDINPKKSQELLAEFQADINPILAFIPTLFHDDLESEFLPNSFVYYAFREFLKYYDYKTHKKENAVHREIKSNLPEGFSTGQRIIPKGREQHIGFYPQNDSPNYIGVPYSNGRQNPERAKKPKRENGYWRRR